MKFLPVTDVCVIRVKDQSATSIFIGGGKKRADFSENWLRCGEHEVGKLLMCGKNYWTSDRNVLNPLSNTYILYQLVDRINKITFIWKYYKL